MANKAFDNHYFVGGTALALQRGHRISIDIDMFSNALYGEASNSTFAMMTTQSFL
ncbi:MAG: nucleotidyl transferase AbiEii/AbiGii toxin family protein [Bacteroidales bacterium]|nr:nucleotidyl transferase AbiEii/AbiGii toxin family protein [Bacteroidales bacterium]